nr:hypothetical protein [Serratia sp. DD3]
MSLLAQGTGFFKVYSRIGAKRDTFLAALPVEAEEPVFGAVGVDVEIQPSPIFKRIGFPVVLARRTAKSIR